METPSPRTSVTVRDVILGFLGTWVPPPTSPRPDPESAGVLRCLFSAFCFSLLRISFG